ncbi:FMN-binding glutamate synthase family protein [Rhodopirellula sp. MGV]|uniref:FMN-binding glutamate synthase family protein n=1 Tax=Rhodopirellula sp. MGV TaxID=2023130 RepID=UPI000B95EED2|nr:FMN-binding glutamate synthase family protein [Rhodopirellula sp. MGV]OYP32976.1 FMN-binding glutamate synthase family protein [Rhodopirellula sp. MGV]PNY35367.1 FMN-binding glutamate synthase family protein [Rhodopirellula baltica]
MLSFLRYVPLVIVVATAFATGYYSTAGSLLWLGAAIPLSALAILGCYNLFHPTNNLLRIYPLLAYGRFFSEEIRPEIHQYFVEDDTHGSPLSFNDRQMVYERAAKEHQEKSFGTELDVYASGYEWLNHTIAPKDANPEQFRITIGGAACKHPYDMALLNVSSMSFGSLSANAVLALNGGAKLGAFAHATGEGGLSQYHLRPGGDLVWEIGTAYFGCRTEDGRFDPEQFAEKAAEQAVKCVTVKLSQGAKPGLGGVMPASKMTEEIAKVRGVPAHQKCVSPPGHTEFNTPIGLLQFLEQLRELCGWKPVGFKLCIGHRSEFLAICKAMLETNILPDYIIVDGGEGGTGAAPLEFEDHVGVPLTEGLHFVNQSLIACGLRDAIKVGCSGKITSAFGMAKRIIQGADYCNSARAMMLALGCIQAQRCETNRCPTGITTQDPSRTRGLQPDVKKHRVRNFQHATVMEFNRLIASMGLDGPEQLHPSMLMRRVGPTTVKSYEDIYYQAEPNELVDGCDASFWGRDWTDARSDCFGPRTIKANA